MSYKISKELLEAVIGSEVNSLEIIEDVIKYHLVKHQPYSYYELSDYNLIKIDTFFFKCKEWAYVDWIMLSGRDDNCFNCYVEERNGFRTTDFYSDSEQQSVFDACQWLLENK